MLVLEVVDYDVQGESEHYENHVYTVQVWFDQDFYFIQRSYFAFAEFHSKLVRQYPRSILPTFPLNSLIGYTSSRTKRKSNHIVLPLNSNHHNIAKSISATDSKRKSIKLEGIDVAAQKKLPLTHYLKDILLIPEILSSEVLLNFLDEETSIDGEHPPDLTQEDYDQLALHFLLKAEDLNSKTVRKDHVLTFSVQKGDVFVYYFSTKHHDIGFSIKCNEDTCVSYQRYNSHERYITGSVDIINNGSLEVLWDNSYSKWRTKKLYYSTNIVTVDQLQMAKEHSNEYKQSKMNYFKRRGQFKKALSKQCSDLISNRRTDTQTETLPINNVNTTLDETTTDINEASFKYNTEMNTDNTAMKKLMEECNELRDKNRFLQVALSEAETSVVVERNARAEAVQSLDELQQLKEQVEEELQDTRQELDNVRNDYYDIVQSSQSKNEEIEKKTLTVHEILAISDDQNIQPDTAVANFHVLLDYCKKMKYQTDKLSSDNAAMEQAFSKLKGEKKQLRVYALQIKEKSEVDEQKILQLDHQLELLRTDNQTLALKVASLESVIANYQTEVEEYQKPTRVTYTWDIDETEEVTSNEGSNNSRLKDKVKSYSENETGSINEKGFFGSTKSTKLNNPVRRLIESVLLDNDDDDDEEDEDDEEGVPGRQVVVDFAKDDPDEVSVMLDSVANSLMEMMPSWDQLMSSSNKSSNVTKNSDSSRYNPFGFSS